MILYNRVLLPAWNWLAHDTRGWGAVGVLAAVAILALLLT